jgi:N-methylhydantoinase B/oxoprolinase/acetone carboxylase alpha subunit
MPTDLTRPDPIRLKIFKNLYQFIAEQMGIVLQPTFRSLSELKIVKNETGSLQGL